MQDKDIFSQRVTGRPSDEEARYVRNKRRVKIHDLAREDLKNSVSFKLDVVTVVNDDYERARSAKRVSTDIH